MKETLNQLYFYYLSFVLKAIIKHQQKTFINIRNLEKQFDFEMQRSSSRNAGDDLYVAEGSVLLEAGCVQGVLRQAEEEGEVCV